MGFNEFLQTQNTQEVLLEETKRKEKIAKFKQVVEELYSLIKNEWFASYEEEGKMSFETRRISIIEDKIGAYDIDELVIRFAQKEIDLRPKGTNMLGTNARVDIVYHGVERIMLVRTGENITNASQLITISINGERPTRNQNPGNVVWKLVLPNNRVQLNVLTKELLEQTIINIVTNG